MDTKTKALIIVFTIFALQSMIVTYWRYVVQRDFEIVYDASLFPEEVELDTVTNKDTL